MLLISCYQCCSSDSEPKGKGDLLKRSRVDSTEMSDSLACMNYTIADTPAEWLFSALKPCRLVEGWSMPSFMDQTFMAASARANCSATPVNEKPNMFFDFLQFFFLHHLKEGKSNKRFRFDSLSYCHRDYWTTPPQMKSNDKKTMSRVIISSNIIFI